MIEDGEEIYVVESSLRGEINPGHQAADIYSHPYSYPNEPHRIFIPPQMQPST